MYSKTALYQCTLLSYSHNQKYPIIINIANFWVHKCFAYIRIFINIWIRSKISWCSAARSSSFGEDEVRPGALWAQYLSLILSSYIWAWFCCTCINNYGKHKDYHILISHTPLLQQHIIANRERLYNYKCTNKNVLPRWTAIGFG